MRISYHVMSAPAPIGLLFLAATERGLRYLEFLERRSIKRAIAAHEAENPGAEWRPSLLDLRHYVEQLESYFHGGLRTFDLPLDPVGTGFQRAVWSELARIPYGETRSYGQVAAAIGQPRAHRAVGLANHQNPLPIVVPCHRVVGARGELTGYGGGLPRKKWLLAHEARFAGLAFARAGGVQEELALTAPPSDAAAPAAALLAAKATGARRVAAKSGARPSTGTSGAAKRSAVPRAASPAAPRRAARPAGAPRASAATRAGARAPRRDAGASRRSGPSPKARAAAPSRPARSASPGRRHR